MSHVLQSHKKLPHILKLQARFLPRFHSLQPLWKEVSSFFLSFQLQTQCSIFICDSILENQTSQNGKLSGGRIANTIERKKPFANVTTDKLDTNNIESDK